MTNSEQRANPLLDGLKLLLKETVREELESALKDQKQKPEKLLLETDEAATFLNVPATWLASMARERKIKSIKLGHYVRFSRTDLESFIQQMKDQDEKKPQGKEFKNERNVI